MDDIDAPRCRQEYNHKIIASLERFGLIPDAPPLYQQPRILSYSEALEKLKNQGLTYPCYCSRQQIQGMRIYPGTCRQISAVKDLPSSIRIKVNTGVMSFEDRIQGEIYQCLSDEVGDFNIKRRDDIYSYHLATVVDDAFQKITHIVRGYDLLDSTPRQIYLQQRLGHEMPQYMHVPIAVAAGGDKFSKQNHAPDIDEQDNVPVLVHVLEFLGQSLPHNCHSMPYSSLLNHAIEQWDIDKIPHIRSIPVNHAGQRINTL